MRPVDNVAAATVAYLRNLGVERVYGVTGEDHLELLHQIDVQGLRYVAAREEAAACYMAGADARATGTLGVVLVTIAPGMSGAVNGIANAHLDHIPMLILSGQHGSERYPVIVRQGLDSHALVAPVTKWTTRMSSRVNQILAKAVDTALASPPGPVFVEIRDEVACREPADSPEDWPSVLSGDPYRPTPIYDPDSVREISGQLGRSRRPILIVGSRIRLPQVGDSIARLASAREIPVFTSPSAKGLIDPGHPWFAGAFLNGNPEASLLERSDLVLAVGLDANDFFSTQWRYQMDIVAIETDETNTQHFLPITSQVIADVAAFLESLGSESGSSAWEPNEVTGYRRSVRALFAGQEDRLSIPTAIDDAAELTARDALVTVDAGFGKPLMSYVWPSGTSNSYSSSHGLSTMGYALPAANALKAALPNRPIIAFMGDGSLHMRATEIGVAADLGLAPVYVCWVDGALTQVEIKQRRRNLRMVGTSLPQRSCEKIADAFGGMGYDPETRDEFRAAFTDSLERTDRPSLIGARVDNRDRERWFEVLRG